MSSTSITSVKLDPEVKARLQRLAVDRQRKPHALLKEAVEQYVDREEKLQAFRDEARQAWEDYQATGLHATAAEVNAWLLQLAEGHDVEPPECHA